MTTTTLETTQTWSRTTHNDDIMDIYGLVELAYVRHVQLHLPLLIALAEYWDQDYCSFHLPTSEMMKTLLDVYWIWGIPIRRTLMCHMEIIDDNIHGQEGLWLIGLDDHEWEHQVMRLVDGCFFVGVGYDIKLYITTIIATYLCSNKSSSTFPLGLVWIFRMIYERGSQFAWGPIILM